MNTHKKCTGVDLSAEADGSEGSILRLPFDHPLFLPHEDVLGPVHAMGGQELTYSPRALDIQPVVLDLQLRGMERPYDVLAAVCSIQMGQRI